MNNGIEQNLRQKIAFVCLFCQCYKNTGTQGTMGPIIGCRPWGGGGNCQLLLVVGLQILNLFIHLLLQKAAHLS